MNNYRDYRPAIVISNCRINCDFDWNQYGYGNLDIQLVDGRIEVLNDNLGREDCRRVLIELVDKIISGNFLEFRDD